MERLGWALVGIEDGKLESWLLPKVVVRFERALAEKSHTFPQDHFLPPPAYQKHGGRGLRNENLTSQMKNCGMKIFKIQLNMSNAQV